MFKDSGITVPGTISAPWIHQPSAAEMAYQQACQESQDRGSEQVADWYNEQLQRRGLVAPTLGEAGILGA